MDPQGGFSCISGLLIEGLDEIPDGYDFTVTDEDLYLLMFRQTTSRARASLCTGLSNRHRFAGRAGAEHFLDACAGLAYPWAAELAAARPAGPCGTVVGDDAWVPTPFVDGVVLVGDAAGFGDPILGEGLSMALRDARRVRDLILDGATTPEAFESYGTERLTRVELFGLLADIVAVTVAEDCDNRAARNAKLIELLNNADSPLAGLMLGMFASPEAVAVGTNDVTLPERIRAAA